MNFPQIQIHTTKAMLGLDIEKPVQHIEQPKADLYIEQKEADLRINTRPVKLSIDQSQAWRDMNLLGPLASTKEFAQKGQQKLFQGIARRANEGKRLMQIENGGGSVQSVAKGKGMKGYSALNIKFIPSYHAVKITYQPGEVNIEATANKPIIEGNINKPIHEYQPGSVEGYMIQYPSIEIDVVG